MIVFDSIRYKNFLSYGNYWTEVCLNDNTNVLIVGKNGHGKSVLLDAIVFALFGRPYRKINKPNLINTINNKDCLVEIEFSINSHKYLVRRGIKPGIFEVHMDGELINQDSKNKDYQKVLEKQILKLNYQSFSQIVILGSAAFDPFMQLSTYQRKQVIEDLLDISIFSVMNDELKFKINQSRDKLFSLKQEISFQNDKIKRQNKFIKEHESNTKEQIRDLRKDIKNKVDQINEFNESIGELDSKIDALETFIQISSSAIKEYKPVSSELSGVISKIQDINKKKQFLTENSECPKCFQKIDEEFCKQHVYEYDISLEPLETQLKSLTEKLTNIEKSMKDAEDLKKTKMKHENDKNVLYAQIKTNKTFIDDIENKIKLIKESKFSDTDAHKELDSMTSELSDMELKYKKLFKRFQYFQEIEKMINDGGIKAKIIRSYIPTINSIINKYLSKFDFPISFHLNEQFEETLKSRYRDTFSYNSFSEGEKTKIDLSILFAWREISKLKNSTNTNLLLMDEIFDSSLDGDSIPMFIDILRSEQNQFKTIIISHNDKMRDFFDTTLFAIKDGNFSHLKQF